jgi:NAD(P)H-hydrate epimerase
VPHLAPSAVAVVNAATAAAHDAAAIRAGIPSRALMGRAGAAAAALIAGHFAERLASGVLVATGAGNNGGDGWVIAHALHAVGVPVRVVECAAARSADAVAERAVAIGAGVPWTDRQDALLEGSERIAVDALLGTGFAADAPLRDPVAAGVARLAIRRDAGCAIVAIDLPSGLDAGDGLHAGACPADLTVTFGTIKRGHLVARELCGRIIVADIGLGAHGSRRGGARLADAAWFRATLPRIGAGAHKGTRGKVAIVGGGPGMGGAAVLAARGALRSGAGMVQCIVSPDSLATVREAEPAALTASWPASPAEAEGLLAWADVVLLGPGLGRDGARALVERVLGAFRGPVVLDADALNACAGDLDALRALVGDRQALLTPHEMECARLAGIALDRVLDERFTLPAELAARTGAAVLLKGVPTVVASVAGDVTCIAEGTPVLATGGSGDVLGGIAATLLAASGDAALAGALAAFAHGRAARAVAERDVRGRTLDDVLGALGGVWSSIHPGPPRPPVLADLPAVGERPPGLRGRGATSGARA